MSRRLDCKLLRRGITHVFPFILIAMSSSLIRADDPKYTKYVRSHLNRVIQDSVDDYGPDPYPHVVGHDRARQRDRLPEEPLPARVAMVPQDHFAKRVEPLLGPADDSGGLCDEQAHESLRKNP